MNGQSLDLTDYHMQQLRALLPDVFVEDQIDFDRLKDLLGQRIIPNNNARYAFSWHGKDQAIQAALTPSMGSLRPCPDKSKDWHTTGNLYIEGDNLEALKILQKSYFGRVKMIYIDPPYNTGNDFVYPDDYRDSISNYLDLTGQRDDQGQRISSNPDTSGRYHTDWLNMIYPRLRLARHFLSRDGVIFISIDDHEVHNLRKVCDEIFGEDNFVAQLVWERAYAPKNDAKYISNSHDYVLMYAKCIDDFTIGRLPRTEEADARYSNPDNDPRGVWQSDNLTVKTYSQAYDYPITTPSGRVIEPPAARCWSLSRKNFLERLQDNRIWFGADGNGVPRIKRFLSELKFDGMAPTSILFYKEVGHSQEGAKEVVSLFEGKGHFDGPKPVRLLRRLIRLANLSPDSIVMDFFSGSATTAHAVMQLNAEDGGKRQFICVQLPEPTDPQSEAHKAGYTNICQIGCERIRRAGEKIKADSPLTTQDLDTGFRYFHLDTSNLVRWQDPLTTLEVLEHETPEERRAREVKAVETAVFASIDNLLPGRTEEDLLYELILKMGLRLTEPIRCYASRGDGQPLELLAHRPKPSSINDAPWRIYLVAGGMLMLCLSDGLEASIADDFIALHRKYAPPIWRVLCYDNGFNGDQAKTNAHETLKCHGLPDEAFATV